MPTPSSGFFLLTDPDIRDAARLYQPQIDRKRTEQPTDVLKWPDQTVFVAQQRIAARRHRAGDAGRIPRRAGGSSCGPSYTDRFAQRFRRGVFRPFRCAAFRPAVAWLDDICRDRNAGRNGHAKRIQTPTSATAHYVAIDGLPDLPRTRRQDLPPPANNGSRTPFSTATTNATRRCRRSRWGRQGGCITPTASCMCCALPATERLPLRR